MKKSILAILSLAIMAGCSTSSGGLDIYPAEKGSDAFSADGMPAPEPGVNGGGNEQGIAGVVTAGEWNDLDNWQFWSHLMTTKSDEQTQGYDDVPSYWKFWTDRRVAISVKDGDGNPQAGVSVILLDGTRTVWTAVTDVLGRADCWIGMYDPDYQSGQLSVTLNGTPVEGSPQITGWDSEETLVNEYSFTPSTKVEDSADILFIVDATGSMYDEIDFLKADLKDILNKASNLEIPIKIRTGALFYRDKGDDYLTRESAFSSNFSTTINFIGKQYADGGGDYPEAVHTALEQSIQKFDWNSKARARLAFMLLDAPPHHDDQGVIESLQKSVEFYAAHGIKLIPIAASGIDKPTEFLLRTFAIATDGTYVFITNDSGVGNEHIEATVGQYEVEKLNDLIVRLIQKYLV